MAKQKKQVTPEPERKPPVAKPAPAPRAVGSAVISFGLVTIPVKVYTATKSHDIGFNLLAPDGARVQQQYISAADGAVVARDKMVKGYEYAKGQFVKFSPEELKALESDTDSTIEIVEFVFTANVDPVFYEKTNYIGPDTGAAKGYRLLAATLRQTGKAAIGLYSARGKRRLVLIREHDGVLLLHALYYSDEVRNTVGIVTEVSGELKEGELALAAQLVDNLSSEEFEPGKYEDEHFAAVQDAIAKKIASGGALTIEPRKPAVGAVGADLLEALKASLGAAKKPTKKGRAA